MSDRSAMSTQKSASASRTWPTAPSASSARRRAHSGWCCEWNASITTRPDPSARAATSSASAAFAVKGFSQRTCLPAAIARRIQTPCSAAGVGTYTASTSGSERTAS
ncbi:hypothetical protein CHO01_09890 [Cellulomonas hominis]|uniref:Uncharacterized protein n=1 Tax=Cellulomonas hominis TaxID=156981 RepID=A0A511F9F7_9CELL|nr:hypothetical protein CHO01_09890 [Cellulomonas hominis]